MLTPSYLAWLKGEVRRFRAALLTAPPDELAVELRGKLDADILYQHLLGIFLRGQGLGDFWSVQGPCLNRRGEEKCHGWLIGPEGIIVDLAADHFQDFPDGPYVGHETPWHRGTRHPGLEPWLCDWTVNDGLNNHPLRPNDRTYRESYAVILSYLPPLPCCACGAVPPVSWTMTITDGANGAAARIKGQETPDETPDAPKKE